VPSVIIVNPYREDIFFRDPSVPRDRDLVLVGRLVSDKGVDLLIEAIHRLRERRLYPNLTIVGGGPEREPVQRSVKNLELTGRVEFAGIRTGPELNLLLNRHRTIVLPSRWKEPFGLVALEGIAAIVASQGGLPEALASLAVPLRANPSATCEPMNPAPPVTATIACRVCLRSRILPPDPRSSFSRILP
jgi:glycogen synthase